MQNKIGLTLATHSNQCQDIIDLAVKAEQLGYQALWLADTGFPDPLTLAGQLFAATSEVDIGIAVVPAYTRTPAVLASSTATLNQLSTGRFVMGLGSSSQTMMENWHGLSFHKPLTRVLETLQLMRSMLSGDKSAFNGDTVHSHGFKMPPIEHPQRIYLAALRAKMLEAAGEYADGVILNMFPQSALNKIIKHIAIGAERAGRNMEDIDIVVRYQVSVTEKPENDLPLFQHFFAPYFATPVYNKFLAWAGYPEVAQQVMAGWQEKNREKTTGAFSEELIREIAIIGSEENCHARIRSDMAAGVTTAMITPASLSEEVRETTLQAFSKDRFTIVQ